MLGHRRSPLRSLGLGLLLAGVALPVTAHGDAPAEPTVGTLLTSWSLDPLPWIGTLVAAGAYLLAVRSVNRAHPDRPVPRWRIAAWMSGLVLLLIALVSSIDAYATTLLSVHMVQHLLLSMVVPPLLALGAPVTLVLRAAPARMRHRLLLPILHSRAVRVLGSPFVAWPVFTAALWASHFTGFYNAALENPLVHDLEHGLFLVTGALFWWPVVSADPRPRRLSHGLRLVYLGAQMPVGAVIGLAIYFAPSVLYEHYLTVERGWGPSTLIDQQIGGLIMWGAGDLALLVAMAALVADWMRHDIRRSRRADLRMGSARD
jgi:putative copper resistance protein D